MADGLQQIRDQVNTMSADRKILLLFLLAFSMAGSVVFWLWAKTPDYQVLYRNLSSEDAQAVASKLAETKTPYQLSPDGSSILAPSEKIHALRMELASQGLPQGGGIGFEIFDRNSFGTTEFVQKLNYRRALQGELARTVQQLAAVRNARVHLVVPERSLFADRQEEPRASVVVVLHPGRQLSSGQIQGIVHLIASGVEGMNPQNVTVLNSQGQILSSPSGESLTVQLTHSQLDYQGKIENEFEEKIRTMLERVVGPQKAVVRVSSTLDFRQVEFTEEKFDPDTQVVRSEQRQQETSSESSTSNGAGVPGVGSNLPGTDPTAFSGEGVSENASKKKNEVINYEINKTISRVIEPVGRIKKLSVAALVDGTYETAPSDSGEAVSKYVPRSQQEMQKLEELVKKAMGYSQERGDQVEVVNVPFENGLFSQDESSISEVELSPLSAWMPVVRYAVGGMGFLFVFFFVVRPIMKILMQPQPMTVGRPSLQRTGEQPINGLPERGQMIQMAKENPQMVAAMLRKWLQEK